MNGAKTDERNYYAESYIAYHRTSTKDQHLDRGIAELTKYCADNAISLYKGKVYTDQQTGKNFNRPRYTMLKEEILESGDVLIVTDCCAIIGLNQKDLENTRILA